MSIASVQSFLATLSEDQSLQEELATAMNSDNDREAVTALAIARGFDFTSDELAQEIQNRQAEAQARQEAGELSDEELEAVAGGEFVVLGITIAAVSAAAGVAGLTYVIGGDIGKKIKW
jgi:predicted ribosomally synthesized peptide with nif11-like leader